MGEAANGHERSLRRFINGVLNLPSAQKNQIFFLGSILNGGARSLIVIYE
jgi:hypothetical protein